MPITVSAGTTGSLIRNLPPGPFLTITKIAPIGALQARRQATGAVSLFWRYSFGTTSERVPIGLFDARASPKSVEPTAIGLSVAAAIRVCEQLAVEHHGRRNKGGRPALVAARADARRVALAAERDAIAAKAAAGQHTLAVLLDHYCDHLQALGRRSHSDARSIFKLHVVEAWPAVTGLPAAAVTAEMVADMMRRVLDQGKGRTANKLRSYMRSAYATARAARSKASIPLHFKAYGITTNPAADTEPDESQNKTDKNPLDTDELRTYWRAIRSLPEFRGAVLRLHLLTGGQRIEQLVSLLTVNTTDESITLLDGKGRPGKPPRLHTVPLVGAAATALVDCKPEGVYALSTDGGSTHLAATTLSGWSREVAADAEIADFSPKRVRSGVETLLASVGVSKETRGRLQSHGVSGVQARHYDGHDYMTEKRNALETLRKLLEQKQSINVTAFQKRHA